MMRLKFLSAYLVSQIISSGVYANDDDIAGKAEAHPATTSHTVKLPESVVGIEHELSFDSQCGWEHVHSLSRRGEVHLILGMLPNERHAHLLPSHIPYAFIDGGRMPVTQGGEKVDTSISPAKSTSERPFIQMNFNYPEAWRFLRKNTLHYQGVDSICFDRFVTQDTDSKWLTEDGHPNKLFKLALTCLKPGGKLYYLESRVRFANFGSFFEKLIEEGVHRFPGSYKCHVETDPAEYPNIALKARGLNKTWPRFLVIERKR